MATPDDDAPALHSTDRPTTEAGRPKSKALSRGRYVRRSLLGRGGLGEVWLTHDRELDRYVALKVITPSASPEMRERFAHEARLQAALEHPGIAPVYDTGTDEEGRAFFVMQHIAGEPLSQILKRRTREPEIVLAWPQGRLIRLFIEICRSVEYAETRNVVHCDLKPENVIVGRLGEPYVIDWGISRRMQRRGDEANQDAVLGSPGYMAPEQLEGRKNVSARTDVYSLGCILYEMLAGRPIVDTTEGIAVWAARVLSGLDGRPSRHVGAHVVPPELDAICVRATAVDPEARYASVRELAHAVEAFENGDRDKALRRALSSEAASSAMARLEASPRDAAALALAMQDVGRALALDPGNREVQTLVERIFAAEPSTLPRELHAVRATDDAQRVREYARALLYGYGGMLLLLAAGTVSGAAPYTLLLFPLAVLAVQLFQSVAAVSAARLSPIRTFVWSLGDVALLLYTALFVGPFFAMPAVMILHVMIAIHLPERSQRRAVFAAHALGFGVPASLELVGVTRFVTSRPDGILTRVAHLPTPSTGVVTGMLVLFGAAVLATAILVTSWLAGTRARVVGKLHWQRWLLGRLVSRAPPDREGD